MIVPASLVSFLQEGSSFFLVSHQDPDGDAIASSLVLGSILSRMGKNILLCSPGPWNRVEIEEYENLYVNSLPAEFIKKSPRMLALDSSTPERLGVFAKEIDSFPCAMIDHHSSGEPFGEIQYCDPSMPSTTALIRKVAEALETEITKEEAWMLLFGLATDTGFFKHLEENSAPVLSLASELCSYGVSLKDVHSKIYSGKRLKSRILLGKTLESTESLFDGRILFTYESLEDLKRCGASARDSDRVYELLQSVRNCEAVFFFRQEDEDQVSVGLRSNYNLDVGTLAQNYGGGGHRKAASFQFTGKTEEIRKILVLELEGLLKTSAAPAGIG